MKVYLIRECGTTKLHGIFWASNTTDLWDAMDEMGDPSVFEYAHINRPGGVWHDLSLGEVRPTLQSEDYPDEPETPYDRENPSPEWIAHFEEIEKHDFSFHPFTQAGEMPLEVIFNQRNFKWTRFDFADEGDGLIARAMDGRLAEGGE